MTVSSPAPENAGRRHLRPGSSAFIALVAALMTMTAMTIDINLPAIPALAEDLGTTLTLSQLTVTIFFFGFALGQAFWGPVSDRYGRKPAMLVGIVLYVLSSIACTFAGTIDQLLAMRFAQGFAAGAGAILGRAMIRDLFEGPQMARIMSLALAAFVTAPIIAPSIGAALLSLGSWRLIFALLTVYGLVLLVLCALLLPESLPQRNPHALRPSRLLDGYIAMARNRASLVFGTVVTCGFCGLTIYLTNASAIFMSAYGMTAGQFGVVFAVVAMFSALGNLANARVVRHLPLIRAIGIGVGGAAAGIALNLAVASFWQPESGWALVPGFCLFFFFFGLIVANGTTLALQPHRQIAGAATSALGVAQTVVPATAASLVAASFDGTARPALLTTVLLLAAGGGVVAMHCRRQAERAG
ncbi:multidrug effflux MFS transporter [Geminicoccaceae bacterium 1502E]|nr:multidrug effflux MFS transporter [Geminicoccaceae bacterium 1502E]